MQIIDGVSCVRPQKSREFVVLMYELCCFLLLPRLLAAFVQFFIFFLALVYVLSVKSGLLGFFIFAFSRARVGFLIWAWFFVFDLFGRRFCVFDPFKNFCRRFCFCALVGADALIKYAMRRRLRL